MPHRQSVFVEVLGFGSTLAQIVFALCLLGGMAVAGALMIFRTEIMSYVTPYSGDMLMIIGGTWLFALLGSLLFLLPSVWMVRELEVARKDFTISMEDVTKAFQTLFAADQADYFTAAREFDRVRERLQYARQQPDLAGLEPDILILAAQMSTEMHELAQTFSAAKIDRAHRFLRERREEIVRHEALIAQVRPEIEALRRDMRDVELDESVLRSRLDQIVDEVGPLLEAVERQSASK